jgi:hypothetical protein
LAGSDTKKSRSNIMILCIYYRIKPVYPAIVRAAILFLCASSLANIKLRSEAYNNKKASIGCWLRAHRLVENTTSEIFMATTIFSERVFGAELAQRLDAVFAMDDNTTTAGGYSNLFTEPSGISFNEADVLKHHLRQPDNQELIQLCKDLNTR